MREKEQLQTLEALLATQRWDEAISMATVALARKPQDPQLYAWLSAAQLGAGHPAEALNAADNAARVAPAWEWTHRMRARALAAVGRPVEALAAAEEADRLEREKPRALEVLASQLLASGRSSDAQATAEELVRIAPQWAESYNTRGGVLLKRRKYEQAESDFREALRLSPGEPVYMNNIGLALNRQGKRKEAIEWFRRAATRDPTFATARRNLFASTRFYLWGGAFLIVATIALHALDVGLRGGPNSQYIEVGLLALLAIVVTAVLVKYWLLRRSLDPIAQTFYTFEGHRAWRHFNAATMIRVGLALIMLAVIGAALFTNQTKLAGSVVLVAIVVLRGWEIVRFARRRLER